MAKTITEFKKFITGYNWYAGVRLAIAVMLPSIVLYHYGLLIPYLLFPFGIFMLGISDTPGAFQRRIGALLIGIVALFFIGLIAGLSREIFWLSVIILMLLGIICSLVGIYGTRMTNIGNSCLIAAIFFMDKHFVPGHILLNATYMAVGGIFYFIVFILSYKVKPYKLIQQMLGENIIEGANLLAVRSQFYFKEREEKAIVDKIMREQVILREQQEQLREIVLKTRELTNESTIKSRMFLMMFLECIDLFELIINSQQNYKQLHQSFDDIGILEEFGEYIAYLSKELQEIGLAVQGGKKLTMPAEIEEGFKKCQKAFYQLRAQTMNAENMEQFIMLRQSLYAIQDLMERVKRFYLATSFDKRLLNDFQLNNEKLQLFLPKQVYGFQMLWDNFSLKSGMFRHAIRVAIALMVGYLIAHIFDFEHGYWIMMTTVIVLKPSYSLARQKNINRISGTVVGALISLIIIYFCKTQPPLFIFLCIGTLIASSFSRVNYFIYAIGITIMVVISFGFLSPNGIDEVLLIRLVNSVIGGVIGYLASRLILPNWENKLAHGFMVEMIEANRKYFSATMHVFTDKTADLTELKLYRKNVFIALANLSDNFQRMLSDPKKQRQNLQKILAFVATSHTISSYLVGLALYAERTKNKYNPEDFSETAKLIAYNFDVVYNNLLPKGNAKNLTINAYLPKNKKLVELLDSQRQLLSNTSGSDGSAISIRKTITDYQTINSLFDLINTVICEEAKITEGFNQAL